MENYTATLKIEDNSRMQLMYASQNYGTFYCVYGKFFSENGILKSIQFDLINYKGLFNIGFIDDNTTSNNIFVSRNIDTLYIGIPLKASTGNTTTEIRKENFWQGKDILMHGIKNIYLFRGLIKMDASTEQRHANFDTEFNYRDGLETPIPLEEREGYFKSINSWSQKYDRNGVDVILDEIADEKLILNEDKSAGLNCRVSNIKTDI